MSGKAVSTRVIEAFADEREVKFGDQYLAYILDAWKDTEAALRKTAFLLVLFAAAFVLLVNAKQVELSLGPVKLTDVSAVLALIPAVVAFQLYELVTLLGASTVYRNVRTELVGRLYPPLAVSDLADLLAPGTASIWGDEGWRSVRMNEPGRAFKTFNGLSTFSGVALLLAASGFIVYAYTELIAESDASGWLIGVSLGFAVFSVTRALLSFVDFVGAI